MEPVENSVPCSQAYKGIARREWDDFSGAIGKQQVQYPDLGHRVGVLTWLAVNVAVAPVIATSE